MTKLILLGSGPEHDVIRAEIRRRTRDYIEHFRFRIQKI